MDSDEKTTQLSLELPKEECILEENIPLVNEEVKDDTQIPTNNDNTDETKEEPKMEEIKIDDATPEVGTANNKKPSMQNAIVNFWINNFTYLYRSLLHYTSCSLNNKKNALNEPN